QHGAIERMLQGAFGSLVMVVAGLGALVSAAMGSYKAAIVMLLVAVGAFGIRAMLSATMGYDDIRYTNASG
ncbi:MAG: hypothetical protein KDD69_18205, partial [Bdellovibrionales bacterium]|nr:hypothetical protein [Bdellovibrionales bacterium]